MSTTEVITAENNIDISITTDKNVFQEFEENIITSCIKIKKCQVSPLDTCLIWSISPERKGKWNAEKVPFVISSVMWKRMYEQEEKSIGNV